MAQALRIGSLLLAILAVGLIPWSARGADDPKLLMLPIVVHSAEDPNYLRDGLSDMLAARFARIGALELMRPPSKAGGTTDLEEALARGRKAGADYVLFGSFTRFGKGASLDVQCAPTAREKGREPLREIFVHSGSIGEIIPDLDELAGKVSRFARGEIVSPGPRAPAGLGIPAARFQELVERVEKIERALEATAEGADQAEAARELR